MKKVIPIIIYCLICFISNNSYAQGQSDEVENAERYVRIVLQNGNILEGKVLEITIDYFVIETEMMGETKIDKLEISSIVNIEESEFGKVLKVNTRSTDINPQASRYFYSPSAFPLEKGEGYYHNVWLAYNSISYGITDNLTTGVTMTPLGTGATFKLSKKVNDNLHISAGAIGVFPFSDDVSDSPLGIAFVNTTFGDERKNFSINYGIGFLQTDRYYSSWNYPLYTEPNLNSQLISSPYQLNRRYHIFNLSSMIEVNSRLWIMMEGYFCLDFTSFPTFWQYNSYEDSWSEYNSNANYMNQSFILTGIRKASAVRDVLWDFGFVSLPIEEVYGIPWIGATVPF